MTRRLLITALITAVAATAQAQSKVLVLVGEVVDNQFIFGRNADDPPVLSQRVLEENRGLHGISSEDTIIKPDSSVNSQTPIKAFVTTASFPNSGDAGPVERICLDGGQTGFFNTSDPDVAHAILIAAHRPAVRFCRITNWRGIGIQTQFDPALGGSATHQITGNTIQSCHIGIRTGSGDQKITDNTILGCRDYGLYIAEGNTHNVSAYNHYYGMANSDNDGTAVFNDDDAFRSIGDTFADSHYGYIGPDDTDFCTFYGLYCQRNNRRAMLIAGTENTIIGSTFNLPYATDQAPWNDVRGVEITSFRNSIIDSTFWLSNFKSPATPGSGNGPATAIKVSGDNNRVMNCRISDFAPPVGANARGIHIPSAIEGFEAEVFIWGFQDSNDVFLDVDSSACTGLDIMVHGNSADTDNFPPTLDHTNVKQYVSLPGGLDNTNQIRFVNDATGQVLELDETQTYD